MRLALRELRRQPGRFATAAAILALVAALVIILGGLLDGLIDGSTSAIRAQDGDVIVYSDAARSRIERSRIDAATREVIDATAGVASSGGLGAVQLGARLPDDDPRSIVSVVLFGYELPPDGVPDPPERGAVYADGALRRHGVDVGTQLVLGPARTPVVVIEFVDGLSYSGAPTLWAEPATWREALAANRPDVRVDEGAFQVLVARADGGVDASRLVDEIDAATGGATTSLTLDAAVDALPGVQAQRTTFNQIISVTVVVAGVVVALFFALVTVERLSLYGVLKALGAHDRTLLAGVILQSVAVTLVACTIATALAVALDRAVPPGGIPLSVSAGRVVLSTVLLLVAATVGCAMSLRRVVRVDPATAIGAAP